MSTVRIQLRRGTSTQWTSINPVLAGGEAGFESDTLKIKIGDGTTHWNDLGYATVTPAQLSDAIAGVVAGEIADYATLTDLSGAIAQEVIDRNAAIATAVTTVGGADFIGISEKGAANGVATLDSNGKVLDSEISSNVVRQEDLSAYAPLLNPVFTGKVTLNHAPEADLEAATKRYVDNIAVGIKFLTATKAATTQDLSSVYSNGTNGVGATLTASANSILEIDGYTPSVDDRVIVKNQSDNKQNGIYVVTNTGSSSSKWVLTRSSDFDGNLEPVTYGSFAFNLNGDTNGGYGYVFTSSASPVVIGTSDISFQPFNAAKTLKAGRGLTQNNASLSVDFSLVAPIEAPQFTGSVILPETTAIGETTSAEIARVHGVTSAIQPQIDAKLSISNAELTYETKADAASTYETKADASNTYLAKTDASSTYETKADAESTYAPKDSATFVGNVTLPSTTQIGDVSAIEIGYLDGVTSSIQTQLNSKLNSTTAESTYLSITDAATEYDAINSASNAQSAAASYTDGKIATEVTNRNNAISASLVTAESYADTKKAEAISTSESYADTAKLAAQAFATAADSALHTTITGEIATAKSQAISTAGTYTDSQISNLINAAPSTLDTLKELADAIGDDPSFAVTVGNHINTAKADAEAYTDSAISTEVTNRNNAINTAKNQAISTSETYTDNAISGEVSNRNSAIATSLSTAESYADTKKSEAISTSETYTDTAISTEVTNRNSAIATAKSQAITTAENYTDNAISTEVTNRNNAISGIVKTTDTGSVTSAMILDGTIVDGDISTSAAIVDTKLATISSSGKVANSATTATDANTASAIVARDASGNFTANLITVNTTPTANGHAASKAYVDNVASGMNWHVAVKAASTANSGATYNNGTAGVGATLTADTNRTIANIDNASVVVGNRILMKDQTDAKQNGIYVVTTLGSGSTPWVLTRATDANNSTPGQVAPGDAVYVQSGTVNANQAFIETAEGTGTGFAIVLGTDSLTWTQFTGAANLTAGNGLTRTGNSIDVVSSTLNVTADAVDLATVSQTNTTGGNLANGIVSAITVDSYGRVTGYQTGAQNVASTSNKGIASFDSASFTVTSGNVVIKSAGISNTQLANSSVTVGTTAIALGSSSTTLVGLTSVSSTGFTGALTGNADTATLAASATKLATARAINGVNFDGTAAVTVKASTTNPLTIGTGLTGTSFDGSGAVTIAVDTTVVDTLTGVQTLTNKTLTSPTIDIINAGSTASTTASLFGNMVSGTASIVNGLFTGTLNIGASSTSASTTNIVNSGTVNILSSTGGNNKVLNMAHGTGVGNKNINIGIAGTAGTTAIVLGSNSGATSTIALQGTTSTTGDLTVGGNATVTGNLTVNGTTTTINSTTLNTTEQVLVISNTATPTDVTANGAGISVRGTTDKTLKWYSSTGSFNSSESLNLATGKTFMINGTTVLSPTAVGGQTIPASAIVGLTDTQTLTNKTLTAPSLANAVHTGTTTVSSSGITFSDGTVQTVAAVPSITTIGTALSASTTLTTGLKDQMIPVGASVVVTLPQDSAAAYPVGSSIDFYATGTGASFAAGTGATITVTPGLKLRAVGSVATAMKVAANTWLLFGDLSA